MHDNYGMITLYSARFPLDGPDVGTTETPLRWKLNRTRRLPVAIRSLTTGGLTFVAALASAACASTAPLPKPAAGTDVRVSESQVRYVMSVLADDSLKGRMTGSPGSASAAAFIASQMREIGLVPEGDSGYFQRVPIALTPRSNGQMRLTLLSDFAALDTFPVSQRRPGVNVVGMIRGSDPALSSQVVLVDAHYDHLGVGVPVKGDSIYNGADDDASGTTAVVEIARSMAAGAPPRRSILFVATTGEEVGLLGTRWFIANPPVALRSIVSNLEIEMIGRPDSLAGGRGRAWLTGYERSTMGAMFTAAGLPIAPDARPSQHFFERSDNIAFARMGIPAHTLSSYNMHADYHRPSDELSRIDFGHMTGVIQAGVRAVRILADGPAPHWNAGGQPAAQ
ncbi:MAG: M28 family peptidase [Gemmatimonadota bacterium]|nr:M28 family peptidase [Gemmatimonadota bacterium]